MDIYCVYNTKEKAFILTSGYYGNETNIQGFKSKDECQKHIETYYRGGTYRPRKMRTA